MKMTLFTLCLLPFCTVLMMASAQEVTSVEENKAIADITAFIANQSQPNSGINNVSIMCKTIFLFYVRLCIIMLSCVPYTIIKRT